MLRRPGDAGHPDPGVLPAGPAGAAAQPSGRPDDKEWDVVMILTDDQPIGTLQGMPNLNRLLMARE